MNKCEICNKHKVAFTNLETNEKICLKCGIKIQYKKHGLKSVFKVIKFYIKDRWLFKWQPIFEEIIAYIILIALWLISWFSLGYVLYSKQYWLLPSELMCLLFVVLAWKNDI